MVPLLYLVINNDIYIFDLASVICGSGCHLWQRLSGTVRGKPSFPLFSLQPVRYSDRASGRIQAISTFNVELLVLSILKVLCIYIPNIPHRAFYLHRSLV